MKIKVTPQLAVPLDQGYPYLSVTAPPISLRADDAARLLGATIRFVEELMREGALPFVWFGKRRVIYHSDLIAWAQKERTKQLTKQRISEVA